MVSDKSVIISCIFTTLGISDLLIRSCSSQNFILSAIFTFSFWMSLEFSIGSKPFKLKEKELKQIELNEQFISAKILADKLDQVYTLFSRNLALSAKDSMAEEASLPFLKNITDLMNKNNVALILGDNFFYGESLTKKLKKCVKLNNGAKVILHWVSNPSSYGVAKINNKNNIVKIIEKPKKNFSNLAVTGLYFFDNKVIKYCENLKPSKRNEIEIVDLLNKYKKKSKLSAEFLGRGGAWLDSGSINNYYDASAFVSALENRQGLKIACLEEIAFNNKWISKSNIINAIKFYGNCEYSKYLLTFIKKKSK